MAAPEKAQARCTVGTDLLFSLNRNTAMNREAMTLDSRMTERASRFSQTGRMVIEPSLSDQQASFC
jgi:hypothetical protein